MIAFLGALLGFFGSAFPDIMRFFREKEDRKHELDILDRQMEIMKLGHSQRLEEIQTQADMQEVTALYRHAEKKSGAFIDALAGSVRPLITYAFFMLYAALKVSQMVVLYRLSLTPSWAEVIIRIWHEEDQDLFATIMSIWFCQRSLNKFLTRPKK